MGVTTTYYDVSHFQGDYHPTGATAAKATEGAGFTDGRFAATRARCRAAGYPFIAYHFLAHGSIAAQVAHVIAVIGKGQPLMLDVESEPNRPDPTLADVTAFADAYAQQSGGGRVTLAYIPRWFWSGHWGSPSLAPIDSRGIGLISSNYTSYSDSGPGWQPYGGVAPVIWQYTSTPLDKNAFRGSISELRTTFEEGPIVPLSDADKAWIKDAIADGAKAAAAAVWNEDVIPNPAWRADSPLAKPAGKNPNITTGHALEYALNEAHAASAQAKTTAK